MSDHGWIDRQPFGFSFGNRRPTDGRDAFGPEDAAEGGAERICGCGIRYVEGCWWTAHDFEPCR